MKSLSKPKIYKVAIEGKNFLLGNNETAKGFIAPRIIQAFSLEQAIELAMETILNDETLQDAVKNTSSDSPILSLDTVEEIIDMNQSEFLKAKDNINKKYFFYNTDE